MLNFCKKTLVAGASSLLLFSVLISAGAGSANAAEAATVTQSPQQDVFRIVALGDSITAGYEPGMTESTQS